MAEHQIRLRGGWEYSTSDAPGSALSGWSLPTRWLAGAPRRVRLIRRFGRPPLEPGRHALLLKLDQVPGIHRLLLNDQPIGLASPGRSSYEIPLDSLNERNILVLDVETPDSPHDRSAPAPEWGFVSLVIRPIEDVPG